MTSWENVNKWYDSIVGEKGHYYHQNIVLPKILSFLKKYKVISILDLGCGQGVLEKCIPSNIDYCGVDISSSFIESAKKTRKSNKHQFICADITTPLPIEKKDFDAACIVLTLQDIANPYESIKNASKHLKKNGLLYIVINHPYFRIPRQTSWEIDERQHLQYRRVNRYLSPLKIPINIQPSKGEQGLTVTHHHFSLSQYSQWLFENGFSINLIEEWVSDKTSSGKKAKMENLARKEIPLFMFLIAKKNH